MGTRETRRQRGRRRGEQLVRHLVGELRTTRETADVSQRAMAAELDCSQSEVNRLEQYRFLNVPIPRLAEMAAILGLDLLASLTPMGDPIRDRGHQALIARFAAIVAAAYMVAREVPLPLPGDLRSWDMVLRIKDLVIGVEAETRIRDIQALVRRIRQRERGGGVDEILIVLSDTAHNRRLVPQLREALGERFATSPRSIIAALRSGRPLVASGVILV